MVHEHLDGRVSIRYGPHLIAQYAPDQLPPQAPEAAWHAPAARRQSGGLKQFGRRSFIELEALPPNLRDLTLLARTAGSGASLTLAPAVPALSRRSSCVPAWLYPPLR